MLLPMEDLEISKEDARIITKMRIGDRQRDAFRSTPMIRKEYEQRKDGIKVLVRAMTLVMMKGRESC